MTSNNTNKVSIVLIRGTFGALMGAIFVYFIILDWSKSKDFSPLQAALFGLFLSAIFVGLGGALLSWKRKSNLVGLIAAIIAVLTTLIIQWKFCISDPSEPFIHFVLYNRELMGWAKYRITLLGLCAVIAFFIGRWNLKTKKKADKGKNGQ